MIESLLFLGAGVGVGAGKKMPGAGQKRTDSTTLGAANWKFSGEERY